MDSGDRLSGEGSTEAILAASGPDREVDFTIPLYISRRILSGGDSTRWNSCLGRSCIAISPTGGYYANAEYRLHVSYQYHISHISCNIEYNAAV
jgi:hypothetical protein